ncbi:uncharacterized protein LOC108737621 [Agrilus planipennis]|uniref:Uncharacterized protein LOC108737621 n=1 Tax=Agrilus planipennis TaxID=224129 RepID=A0A1W4X0Z7_AGRPL|nr:uncharacterized protein LOC108737621 [Agrilus planipennis]
MCHETPSWTQTLPNVLLGIRSAWKEDLKATAAEMVYGQTLRLPGEFLSATLPVGNMLTSTEFVNGLRQHISRLRPQKQRRHGEKGTFVFKDLNTTQQVFVRRGGSKEMLQPPYDGPYPVVRRSEKTFVILINGGNVTVTIDRLKPTYVAVDETIPCDPAVINKDPIPSEVSPDYKQRVTRYGRHVHFPDRLQINCV